MITINETRQNFFDKVVEHLAKQGQQSMMDGRCRYKTPDGLKCAIGIFIPDDKYKLEFEGRSIYSLERGCEVVFSGEADVRFASDLQSAHDSCTNVPSLRESLYSIARTHRLDSSKLSLLKVWNGK